MPKLYLLDANVFITANSDYFPKRRIPQYWEWLLVKAEANTVKTPLEIYQEITPAGDDFSKWIKSKETKTKLILNEIFNNNIKRHVLSEGYDKSEPRSENQNNDAILMAYAMANESRVIVTKEGKGRDKIPYVCQKLGIKYMNDFEFQEECDFRIP